MKTMWKRINKRSIPVALAGIAVLIVAAGLSALRSNSPSLSAAPAKDEPSFESVWVSGPGRIEPLSENINIGSELSGKLKSVNVEEGDTIRKGQVLAVLENADYKAEVLSAEAEVGMKEAALRKIIGGARRQERAEAVSSTRAAKAVMDHANAELERRKELFAAGVISKEDLERSKREDDVAKANYQEMKERESLIQDHPREEDQSFAEADLKMAQAHLAEARARYEKTVVRSPVDGTVLRKQHRNGESVSSSSTQDAILIIGDTSILRVRVDVDETEVVGIHVGQKAYVTADAYGKQKFRGRVVRIGEMLGPKNVHTGETTEHVDTKILEVLLELDRPVQLPVGLRVAAYILTNEDHGRAPQP
jgi:HlyD family secretion protein